MGTYSAPSEKFMQSSCRSCLPRLPTKMLVVNPELEVAPGTRMAVNGTIHGVAEVWQCMERSPDRMNSKGCGPGRYSQLYSLTCTRVWNFPELFRYPRHETPPHLRPCLGVILWLFGGRPSPQDVKMRQMSAHVKIVVYRGQNGHRIWGATIY